MYKKEWKKERKGVRSCWSNEKQCIFEYRHKWQKTSGKHNKSQFLLSPISHIQPSDNTSTLERREEQKPTITMMMTTTTATKSTVVNYTYSTSDCIAQRPAQSGNKQKINLHSKMALLMGCTFRHSHTPIRVNACGSACLPTSTQPISSNTLTPNRETTKMKMAWLRLGPQENDEVEESRQQPTAATWTSPSPWFAAMRENAVAAGQIGQQQ